MTAPKSPRARVAEELVAILAKNAQTRGGELSAVDQVCAIALVAVELCCLQDDPRGAVEDFCDALREAIDAALRGEAPDSEKN